MLAVRRDGVGALACADDRVHKRRCAGEPGRPPCAAATGRPPLPLTALLRSGSSEQLVPASPGAGVREAGLSDAYYATAPSEHTSNLTRVDVVGGRSWYEFAFGSKLVLYKPLGNLGVSAEYLAVIYYCRAKPFCFLLGLLVIRGLRDAKTGSSTARKASVNRVRAAL